MRTARAAAGLALLALAGCESTQTTSARLARDAEGRLTSATVSLGAPNRDVRVLRTAVLRSGQGTAVALQLRNEGAPQGRVPVLVDVRDGRGSSVYRNDVEGLQPALQEMAHLGRGETAWWVNDQVVAATPARRVDAQVGQARAPRPGPGAVRVEAVRRTRDESGAYVEGIVRNPGRTALRNVPVYAVVLDGGAVRAAGRALVEQVAPEPQRDPAPFRIYLVGDPDGGELVVRAHPTVVPAEEAR